MIIYSDVLKKQFATVEECEAAEKEYDEKKKAAEAEKAKKNAERKTRAEEVSNAYKEYINLRDKFVKDFGSYHMTFSTVSKNPISFFDSLFEI